MTDFLTDDIWKCRDDLGEEVFIDRVCRTMFNTHYVATSRLYGYTPEQVITELKQMVREGSVVIDVVNDGEGFRLILASLQ